MTTLYLRSLHPFPSSGTLRTCITIVDENSNEPLWSHMVASVSRANVSPLWDALDSVGTTASSVERPTEESRWLAVLERVAERLLWSSLVDLGTGTLWSSRYLLYFLMWLACVVSHLRREHNSSGFRVFLSSKTFGHKSCILVRFLSIIST